MRHFYFSIALIAMGFMSGCSSSGSSNDGNAKPSARIETTLGVIVIALFEQEAPNTVANFIGLAEGTKTWTDPNTGQPATQPF